MANADEFLRKNSGRQITEWMAYWRLEEEDRAQRELEAKAAAAAKKGRR